MPSGPGERYDFFLSRRGPVAPIAQEVADVLKEKGYKVRTQDYDIPITANFIEEMHEAVKNSRDLVVLFTRDYEQSPYHSNGVHELRGERCPKRRKRRMVILRYEDAPLSAPHVYQDLVGVGEAEERLQIFRSSASQVEGTLHWEENENARVENLLANGGCESRLPVLLVAAPDGAPQQTIHLYRCFQQTDPVDLTLHLLNAPLIAVEKLIAVGTFRLRNNP